MTGTGIAALHEAAPASLEDVVLGYFAAWPDTAGLQLS